MKTLLIDLFGHYSPNYYTDANGVDVIPDGLSGVDIPYVCGVLLFGICLYIVLSTIRGMINRG